MLLPEDMHMEDTDRVIGWEELETIGSFLHGIELHGIEEQYDDGGATDESVDRLLRINQMILLTSVAQSLLRIANAKTEEMI